MKGVGLAASLAAVAQGAKVKFRYGTQVGHHVAENGDVNSRVAVKSPVYKSVFSLSGNKITYKEAPSFFSSSFLFRSKRFIAVRSGMEEMCIVRTAVGFFSENETVPTESVTQRRWWFPITYSQRETRPARGAGTLFHPKLPLDLSRVAKAPKLSGYSRVMIGDEDRREWRFVVARYLYGDRVSHVKCRADFLPVGSFPTLVVRDSKCTVTSSSFLSRWWTRFWAWIGERPNWQYQPNLLEGVTVEVDTGDPLFVTVVTAEATNACPMTVGLTKMADAAEEGVNLPHELLDHAEWLTGRKKVHEDEFMKDEKDAEKLSEAIFAVIKPKRG